MGRSAWYRCDPGRVYAASPARPVQVVPDWEPDVKPKNFKDEENEIDEQMRTIYVGDGLAQWDLDDEALGAVESLGGHPSNFIIPQNVDPNPHHLEYRVATHRYREARERGWLTPSIPEVVDEQDQRELEVAKARRLAFKNRVRADIAVQDAITSDREHRVLSKDRESALRVASIIEMLRADDEGLEEVQNLPQRFTEKKFETRLVDERGRRRYAPRFRQYPAPSLGPADMWRPWGSSKEGSAGDLMNRAQLLKENYRRQPDPRGEALEVGVAFAEAASAAHREANRRSLGNADGADIPEDELVAHLEAEARDFLRQACAKSDVRKVLRRACSISTCKEIVRKRTYTRPEKVREQLFVARKLHARECAAERRRQRKRRQCAHLALLRDSLRSKGRPGRTTSSAAGPDVKSGVRHFSQLVEGFALDDDDDKTMSEDEGDYDAMVAAFAGDEARGIKAQLSEDDLERLDREAKSVPKEVIDARVKAGLLFDRTHSKNNSRVAVDGLIISSRRDRPVRARRGVEAKMTASQKVLATIEDLPVPPSREELRQDRDTLLALFHALFFTRGVRHLDSDVAGPLTLGSDAHIAGASLGGMADCHRQVLEEYVPIRANLHVDQPSDVDDYAELLASLGTLRAKAKESAGAAEMFLRAATERDRRRDAKLARAVELDTAERAHTAALAHRDAVRADTTQVSFAAGPARTPRTCANDATRAESLRKAIADADAAVDAAVARCTKAAAAAGPDKSARDIVPPTSPKQAALASASKRRPSAGSRGSAKRTSAGSARTAYRRNSAKRRPKKVEFAPPSGSYQLPGAGVRSKYHRLDRDLRAEAPKAQHVDTYTMQMPIDAHDHASAPWQEMPLRPQEMTSDLANETVLFRISEPWPQTNAAHNDLTAMRGRPALEPATYLRGGTLLDDPTPYAYSAIRSAQPLGMRSQHEPPHVAATQKRPAPTRITKQMHSGWATSELRESYHDYRAPYAFPDRYDPISGLGELSTFDHPNISFVTHSGAKLAELAEADPSRQAALALHGRDVYDADLIPEVDSESRGLGGTQWAPTYLAPQCT